MSKPQLVLDLAGVIVSNFSKMLWRNIGLNVSFEEFIKALMEVKTDLWTGKLSENEYCQWLRKFAPTIDKERLRACIREDLVYLPAANRLEVWSKLADLHLLSNHREEWIDYALEPFRSLFTSITISSSVGCCKPQEDIYRLVQSHLITMDNVTFVDDQEKNLATARQLGWNTVLADQEGRWIDTIEQHLRVRV